MSKLKKIREKRNLTQEELTEKSGLSIRTIQRIEAGAEPKGHTLKTLSRVLEVEENDLREITENMPEVNLTWIKIINISSLPFTFLPLANVLIPLILMFAKKQFGPVAKQIVSVQIIWSISAFIIFMLAAFMKNWFSLGNKFTLVIMILLVLSNVFIILKNAAEIDKKGTLFFRLNFSII